MADIRSTSSLDIKVNDQDVRKFARTTREAFSDKDIRKYNKAVEQGTKLLDQTRQQLDKIKKEQEQVRQGSKTWEEMNRKVQQLNRTYAELERVLKRVDQAQARVGTSGGGGGAASVTRAGGPSRGGGQWSQSPGSPFLGMGKAGVTSMQLGGMPTEVVTSFLSGIPMVGGMGAGAFQAAMGAYGSHLQNQRARMEAAPYLMPSSELLGFRKSMTPGTRAGTLGGGMELSTNAMRAVTGAKLVAEATTSRYTDAVTSVFGDKAGMIFDLFAGTRSRQQADSSGLSGKMFQFSSNLALQGVEALAGEESMRSVYAKALGLGDQKTGGPRVKAAYDYGSYRTVGRGFGYDATESVQLAQQMSQTAGRPAGAGTLGVGLALQRLFGVDVGLSGGAMRGLRQTGNAGSMTEVATMVALAVASGLEGSEISEELQKHTAYLQQQASQGNRIDNNKFLGARAGLVAQGIDNFRAGDMLRSFGDGVGAMGRRGAQSATDLRMMRAMGYTGKGGFEEYAEYMLKAQNRGEAMAAMPAYLKQFDVAGLGESGKAFFAQRALGQFGTNIGADEAKNIRGLKPFQDFTGLQDTDSIVAAGLDLTATTGGSLVAEAGIRNQRIGVGGQIAGTAQALSRATNSMAKSVGNLDGVIIRLARGTERFAGAIDQITGNIGNNLGD